MRVPDIFAPEGAQVMSVDEGGSLTGGGLLMVLVQLRMTVCQAAPTSLAKNLATQHTLCHLDRWRKLAP